MVFVKYAVKAQGISSVFKQVISQSMKFGGVWRLRRYIARGVSNLQLTYFFIYLIQFYAWQ